MSCRLTRSRVLRVTRKKLAQISFLHVSLLQRCEENKESSSQQSTSAQNSELFLWTTGKAVST